MRLCRQTDSSLFFSRIAKIQYMKQFKEALAPYDTI